MMSYRAMAAATALLTGACAFAIASPHAPLRDPAEPERTPDDCTLKRDGAACEESDPIFREAMEQLNRQREREAAPKPAESARQPD